MIYTSLPIVDSKAEVVIIPVSGTDYVEQNSVHEKFIAELDVAYADHYFREIRIGAFRLESRPTVYFVKSGPWDKRWVLEIQVKPGDRFFDLSPKFERIAYLLKHLEITTVAVGHMKCQLSKENQETFWQHFEALRLAEDFIQLEFHTQELPEEEDAEDGTNTGSDVSIEQPDGVDEAFVRCGEDTEV